MNIEKEKRAIQYLKSFEPNGDLGYDKEPYYLCYSGGKDSDVILTLAKLADVKFEAVHNLTTADAPATVQYVRSNPDVRIDYRDNYLRAFNRMLIARREDGLPTEWQSPREVMMWWVGDNPRQLSLFGEPEYLKGACI